MVIDQALSKLKFAAFLYDNAFDGNCKECFESVENYIKNLKDWNKELNIALVQARQENRKGN